MNILLQIVSNLWLVLIAELVFLASGEADFCCVTSVYHHCLAVACCSVTDFVPILPVLSPTASASEVTT